MERPSESLARKQPLVKFRQREMQKVVHRPDTNLTMMKLCLSGESLDVPKELFEEESIFRAVLNKASFFTLSPASRTYLKQFLPTCSSAVMTEEERKDDEEKVLDCVFTKDDNFCFGNPMSKFFIKVKDGYYSGNVADKEQRRGYQRVLYDHYIRHYYMNLMTRLLINRQIILEQASRLGAAEDRMVTVPSVNYYANKRLRFSRALEERARLRSNRMIKHCKAKVGEHDPSSDDEDNADDLQIPRTIGAESTLYSKEFSEHDYDLHQPIRMKGVKELLREYRHLCETEPDCPSCDISDIYLDKVYERAGVSFQSERNFAMLMDKSRKETKNGHSASTSNLTT